MNFKTAKIPGYDGYLAGEDGNIYSFWIKGKNARIDYSKGIRRKLKPNVGTSGYFGVCLKHNNGTIKLNMVHRIICLAFYGKSQLPCSHLDGNRLNNKIANLIYETCFDNIKRKLIHGTHDRGYKNSRSKINKKQLNEIRNLLQEKDLTHKQIGERFNVNRVFITKINCKYRYNL